MKNYKNILLSILLLIFFELYGDCQDSILQKSFVINFSGYCSFLNTAIIVDSIKKQWINSNLLHNRLNGNINYKNIIELRLEIRNRFIYGDFVNSMFTINSINEFDRDKGIIDLTWNLSNGKSYLLNSTIDRMYVAYKKGNFEISAGRQRINWGQTYVWNPNDLFNVFSYFDFDYPERPGSDAIRIQYYTGTLSNLEFAIKSDSSGNVTSALLYRFNKKGYDVQFFGGILESNDWVCGAGWSGNISKIGYKGELSYFHPFKTGIDKNKAFLISMSLDYMFSNSSLFTVEMLYKYKEKNNDLDFFRYYSKPLTVKDLSFARWNFFTQLNYPLTSLINGTIAFMCFPEEKIYFIGPSISTTFSDNFEFMIYIQYFKGNFQFLPDYSIKNILMSFIRFKYSF